MKFDKYSRTARIYPSIIILIPFLVFTIYCDIENLKVIFDDLLKVKIIGNITISIVLLYLLSQINRFLGKFLFERYIFHNELEMPTTNLLLFSNSEFSKEYKIQIREKINSDFQLNMPSKQDESENLENTKKRIVEAVGLIRQKVKNGRLLLQHNIEYGFARNLIGGAILGVVMSIFDVFYFFKLNNVIIGWFSVVLTIFFLTLLVLHKPIINHLGNQYTKRLFQEYLQK
ncbi:MAG: hypothetical protein KAW92_04025 [Candidatus Cloacimonetes bacterium]|nr:hypothetical protein [Candidatus Cloacimonadota bacterium]